ncbi:hypothetical protein [Conexibacter sp. CPCC 206217]|uniref:hypothetical protein n=1 Tax=Conexibacter sp. CPCC 206217 TaxID=3064574 RepID=UPI00271F6719|nr:hypothetical protein [Conexibacter sp. CPCC 206217]MDO8213650.1 hypothetical protein [Conexibacter sp. CPCC 206217]
MAASTRVIDRKTLGRVGFTDHAIARFGERAGLSVAGRQGIEPIARDLLLQEGRVVARPPKWYRSSNAADAYMQAGEWLLFICRRSARQAGHFDVVTVVNNGDRTTWPLARDRGLIFTPPPPTAISAPPRKRAGLGKSIVAGLRLRRDSHKPIGRLAAILQVHQERRSALSAERSAAREAAASTRQRYEQERAAAHARHLRMWGGRG